MAGISEVWLTHSRGFMRLGFWMGDSKSLLLKNIFRPSLLIFFSGLQNIEYLVLPGCNDNLFALNHSPSFWNSRLTFSNNCGKLDPLSTAVVSSANKKGSISVALGRSLIYSRNRIGPRTEPWGTPISIGRNEDKDVPIETHCFLFVKYDLNQSNEVPLMP